MLRRQLELSLAEIDLGEVVVRRTMIRIHREHFLERISSGGKLPALHLDQALFRIQIELHLLMLDVRRGQRSILCGLDAIQLRVRLVEKALRSIGARQLNPKIRARWIEVRATRKHRHRIVEAICLAVRRAKREVGLRPARIGPDDLLQLLDRVLGLPQVEQREPEIVARFCERVVGLERLADQLAGPAGFFS